MNGSTPAAETLRRYPLTWRLLGCVFQRIPLFSLAKSLADRRFVAVLQQTLKEVSTPSAEPNPSPSPKRKRSPAKAFSLGDLQSLEGCTESSQAIYQALGCLLRRIDDTALVSAHDKIGAEHLKSLFGTPVTEAATIAAPLLLMCNLVLQYGQAEDIEGCEDWVATISSIWSLHLQGSNDAAEVGVNLFTPAATLLANVEGLIHQPDISIPKSLRTRWSADLQKLMHGTLILPARSAFLNHQKDEAIVLALEAAERRIEAAAPAMYLLASTATEAMAQRGVRKGNSEWMKRVFQAVVESIKGRRGEHAALTNILEQARERSMPVSIDNLRSVCRQYALKGDGETDWALIADLAQCDPAVFQVGDGGAELLKEVCARSLGDIPEHEHKAVSDVIAAIIQGFRTVREFSSFLKLWFDQLSEIERRKLKLSSPWLLVGREGSPTVFDNTWVEQELSKTQLVDVIDWVQTQKTRPKALCLWLNAVSQGIQSDDFKDAIGQKLFDLTLKISKSNSDITALKWRIMARAFVWIPLSKRTEVWDEIKDPLSKILRKALIATPETFEAFKCCCRLWVSMSPDGAHMAEAAKLVEDFTARLAAEFASVGADGYEKLPSFVRSETESEFREDSALQQYLGWYLRGSTRLNRVYFEKKGELLPTVQSVLSDEKATPLGLEAIWQSLLDNEHCVNEAKLAENLLDRAVGALAESKKEKHWPGERGQLWLRLISSVPLDAVARQQRERIMAVLVEGCTSPKSGKKTPTKGWNMILSLATKVMARPTFYDGMSFQHLIDVATTASQTFTSAGGDNEGLQELIGRYSSMASAIIKQMAEHIDERSIGYFAEASAFVTRCSTIAKDGEALEIPPLHLTLLKALVQELSHSSNCRNHSQLASLPSDAEVSLKSCVFCFFGEWIDGKKLFSKPNVAADFRLLVAVDAAELFDGLPELAGHKGSSLRKLEKRSLDSMQAGDLRGWKVQTFLQRYLSSELEIPRPATFHSLESTQGKIRESLLRGYVGAIVKTMDTPIKMQYLEVLMGEYHGGSDTDGQLIAIHHVVDQLIGKSTAQLNECSADQKAESTDLEGKGAEFDLSTAHSEMTRALASTKKTANAVHICRILYNLLERKPQAIGQWNIESLLSAIAILSAEKTLPNSTTPFAWLCKLVEVIVKKHRVRLEGHYHILLASIQPLLSNLIQEQREAQGDDGISQESRASAYGRLITLVCEPTAGAVSRSQHHSALDSATDAAKRSAGRHMYLVLMQYVKLQLETDVSRAVREALEPAMNSIFDITPPEGRKILNDAMDASGRAILREMFKRYTKFGKWSGV